jgi:hypothetical protein
LWVNKESKMRNRHVGNASNHYNLRGHGDHSLVRGGQQTGWRRFHDTLMQTLWELEGADMEWDGSYLIKHEPPSGRLTVDFSQWNGTFVDGSGTHAAASVLHSEEHSQARASSPVRVPSLNSETQSVTLPANTLLWRSSV